MCNPNLLGNSFLKGLAVSTNYLPINKPQRDHEIMTIPKCFEREKYRKIRSRKIGKN